MKKCVTISDLSPNRGSKRSRVRVGRGIGSGLGKTSGRGYNGYGARSGSKFSPGFEGGQMPIARRTPKSGFVSPFRVEYAVINLSGLDKFDDGSTVTPSELKTAGLIKGKLPVKILASGKLSKKLTVKANAFSASAKSAIENAGGKTEIIG
ncbi:MAG: 50S ribosomal protein L15 [Candidatus Hydrogenedentes bacterium CG07_land_8_20_14_0_80_42_17]|nr:MAG: 50S ribosomal protein L15 [Candidatus Hydrogenedentes bacterium CG07_land_8_20_14_0_80_42_17]